MKEHIKHMIKFLKRIFDKKEKPAKKGWVKIVQCSDGPCSWTEYYDKDGNKSILFDLPVEPGFSMPLEEEDLKAAYKKYADSHTTWSKNTAKKTLGESLPSTIPMEHSFESFSRECNENYKFYTKYK